MARALVNIPSSGTVGEVKASMLSLAQFQAQFGSNWVLANGGSAVGTKYATITGSTTLPDCRGVGLRGKNNGRSDGFQNPDGDLALGAFQSDNFGSHTHGQDAHNHVGGMAHQLGWGAQFYGSTGVLGSGTYGQPQAGNGQLVGLLTSTSTPGIQANGSNETRMKNVTVNYFIKVN